MISVHNLPLGVESFLACQILLTLKAKYIVFLRFHAINVLRETNFVDKTIYGIILTVHTTAVPATENLALL